MNVLSHALTTYYLKSKDSLGLFAHLTEDGLFGAVCYEIEGKTVSRDLLDSVAEMLFLERHLKISEQANFTVLDVGAGYGRMAHRMLEAYPNLKQFICTDAVPISSFICDYHLKVRGLHDRATSVPLDEIESVLDQNSIDLAINIHSFSECSLAAISWWVSALAKRKIRHVMVIPNDKELVTDDGIQFANIFEEQGYKLLVKAPKYEDPLVQQYGMNPSTIYLFQFEYQLPACI